MYLKSLEVHGFKSFANKLVFEFHNGITAIVGPNGSGKSNVADAVRWVLGEQSAKQLRGAKMEDVIFAGTQMRKPLGYAYVAITINNEDHKLNVPYEEVTIARRVYRSGESEYLLNGATCRLKDVQELLFDTGIGKEGYSIIGQGQIDKILSGKPEERRELFDEAAGIVKFKKRKAAAEKSLAEEEQNMIRIEDILSELEKQVGPLEKQSEKAKEYLKYRDELRSLDVNMFLNEYDRIQEEVSEITGKQDIATSDLERTRQEFEKTKEEYVKIDAILEEHNYNLEENRDRLTAAKVSLNQSEGDVKVIQEQILAAKQNDSHYKERLESIRQSIEQTQEQKAQYEQQQGDLLSQLTGLQEEQKTTQESLQSVTKDIQSTEKEIADCNSEMLEAINAASTIKTEQQRYETLLEQINLKRAELTKRVLENKSEAAGLQEAMEEQKKALIDVSDKIKGMDDINACIQRLGCKDTVLHNPIDFERYHQLGTSTVADYASIFLRLLKGELIGPKEDAKMLEIFKKQHYNSMLTKQFPVALFDEEDCGAEAGAFWVASKSGSMNACRNDGGIVHTPYGDYVIVMFHKEFSDAMYYPEHPATVFGSKVSKLIFDQYLALKGSIR